MRCHLLTYIAYVNNETSMSQTARRSRADMIADTTARLLAAARASFAEHGYAETSMDALCAQAGLTRGALYHHFGGKEGLLEAVARQIDAEMNARLEAVYDAVPDPWLAFKDCCKAYLSMALEPEIQRILLRDAPAVLGQRFRDLDEETAVGALIEVLEDLIDQGRLRRADPEALARLINGALVDGALWIAASLDPEMARDRAVEGLELLLEGLAG